jgi:hypothetical protein
MATDNRFEDFIEHNGEWYSDMELRVLDLEKEISGWRESGRQRRSAEPGFGQEPDEPAPAFRRAGGTGGHRNREFLRATGSPGHERDPGRTSARPTRPGPAARHAWPVVQDEPIRPADRTQVLIDRGRRTARRHRSRPRGKIFIGAAAGLVVLVIAAMILSRKGASWPASVATVQSQITTACQNPNVASEPAQVNFACGKDTSQILWAFSLLTSNDNPGYTDPRTGRKGLEPITPAQGGQIAWSLNLHHPYNPLSPADSLAVAARAINNIMAAPP